MIHSRTIAGCLFVLGVIAGSRFAWADEPSAGKQVAQSVEVKQGDKTEKLQYLLFLPKDYGTDATKKWPTILFLHGAGERGDNLDVVKVHGPPKIVESKPDFGFIVISPQCPKGKWWNPEELKQLLDHVSKSQAVDEERLYLTGLSMGGAGTWNLAAAAPERFAAIAPICGFADTKIAEKIKHLPTWVFHGAKDTAVKLEAGEKMVAAVKAAGGEPKFTVYPEAGHDSWTESYNNPELYKWLLEQKRK